MCAGSRGERRVGTGSCVCTGGCTRGVTGCVCKLSRTRQGAWHVRARTRVAAVLVCAWCLGSARDARGCPGWPWGAHVLRGRVWECVCTPSTGAQMRGYLGAIWEEANPPPCRVGISACRACRLPPLRSLVGRERAVSWAVRAARGCHHPPGASASLCSLARASVLAAGGAVTATDVCPQYLVLCFRYGGDSNSPSAVAKAAAAEPLLRAPCA